jgi:pimeloyl-ACP methyl ester carboxylesterase
VVAVLAVSAAVNYRLAKKAERDNPPTGKFLEINGVRLHYVERGAGDALVMLHGNGSMIEDFASSGLIDLAAKNYRVITFDRPGFGHSERPRGMHGLRLDGDPAEPSLGSFGNTSIKGDGHTSNSGDREDGESSGSNVL